MARIIVREVLREKGISIKELATKMGVTPSAVSQLLANPNPSIIQLERIAHHIGVNVFDLFSENLSYINGFIEVDNKIYSIKNREQLINLTYKVEGIVQIPPFFSEERTKEDIKEFIHFAICEKRNDARMMRYGVNKVITLSYDTNTQMISLTQCVGKGEIKFKTFSLIEYLVDEGMPPTRQINQLLESILTEIEK